MFSLSKLIWLGLVEKIKSFKLFFIMAVPKKRTSKMKRNLHKSKWKRKILKQIERSVSLTKSIEKKNQKFKKTRMWRNW